MKAIFEAYGGLKFEVEADSLREVLTEINEIETAVSHEKCGKCGSDNVFPNYRQVDKFEYFELKCHGFVTGTDGKSKPCGAVLQLGVNQNKKKTLYKKRMATNEGGESLKDEDGKGKYLPDRGWVRYNPVTKKLE